MEHPSWIPWKPFEVINNMDALRKRPVIITLVCIAGFSWILISIPGVFSPTVKKLGDIYPAVFGSLIASAFISLVGIWYMKKWGLHLYIFTFFIRQMILILLQVNIYEWIFRILPMTGGGISDILPLLRRPQKKNLL